MPMPPNALRDGRARKAPEGCTEVKSTEQWRPGEVDITKLKQRFFPYLVASGLDTPPQKELALFVVDSGPRPISKLSERWARPLE
jgi:hypothetical protein